MAAPILLLSSSLLASFLTLEAGARLVLPPVRYYTPATPLELDATLGFRGIPGYRTRARDADGWHVLSLNADGFRGREMPPVGAHTDLRIAFVGDSFLVAGALRERDLVTERSEAALRARGVDAEAYDLAAIDYGTAQELLLLRQLGPRLRPDVVVLTLYPCNDVLNNAPELAGRTGISPGDFLRPYLVARNGELRTLFLNPVRAWLRGHSLLFAQLERTVIGAAVQRHWDWLRPFPEISESESSIARRLLSSHAPTEETEIFRPHPDPDDPWERGWEHTFALLRAFRDEVGTLGARFVVVVVPSVHQVIRTLRTRVLDLQARAITGHDIDAILDWNLPERRLAAFFQSEGIDARFLLGPLRAAAREGSELYTFDDHLGRDGHRIFAEVLLRWLADPSAAYEQPMGAPVRRLPPPAETPALLNLAAEPDAALLGAGWMKSANGTRGRLVAERALAVVRDAPGDLVLRGVVPPGTPLPVTLSIQAVGVAFWQARVEHAGPFELRLPRAPPAAGPDRQVLLVLEPDQPLLARALGFEEQRADRRGPPAR